jgi:putative transposase
MKLNKGRARKIVLQLNKGASAAKLAADFSITKRRVNQVYASYLKTGVLPTIGEGVGRPMKPIQEWEREIVRKANADQRVGARRLEKVIKQDYQRNIGHNRIHGILLGLGLAKPNPKKQRQRKYLSYERGHSLTAVHLDWHTNKREEHVIAVIDDASRKIIAGGEFAAESVETTLAVSEQAITSVADFGNILEFITDNGSVFTCNHKGMRESSEFEKYLVKRNVKHIRIRAHHPQSNGKIEKWFDTYERHRNVFESFDEFVEWYNSKRYHESLDSWDGLHAPSEAFIRRLKPEHVFGLTKGLFNW